jgi:hypothetical protein
MPVDAPDRMHPLREMSLAELRAYRQELREEEHRISYWRRLVQARLDMAAAGRLSRTPLTSRQIAVALGDGISRHQRLGLLALRAGDELPELPELARLWATPLSPSGAEGEAEVIAGLAEAEARLSTYRGKVHRLLDMATAELIRRYRLDPTACLDVLPATEVPLRAATG